MNAIQEIAMAIAVSLFGLAFAAAIVWSVLEIPPAGAGEEDFSGQPVEIAH